MDIQNAAAKVLHWHGILVSDQYTSMGNARALHAQLRRAATTNEVMMTPAFGYLLKECIPDSNERRDSDVLALARTARVMAAVHECRFKASSFGVVMSVRAGDHSVVSYIRADTLFKAPTAEVAAHHIVGLARLVGQHVTVIVSPDDVLWAMVNWSRHKVRWATDFYAS